MTGPRKPGFLPSVPKALFWVLFAAYIVVRGGFLGVLGYEVDVNQYKEWALGSGLHGLPSAYERTSVDYPPVSLTVFWLVGKAFVLSQPPFGPGPISVEIVPTWWIKFPHLVFDLLLGALLYRIVAVRRLWGSRSHKAAGHGRLAALCYWWNPAVLFGSAYWGQLDALHALLVVGSIAALGGDRLIVSAACLAAAGLSKPLAAPLVPLLVFAAALRRGFRGVVVAGASGLAVAILAFSPFWATGRGWAAVERVFFDLGIMPYTSLNAHNFFWLWGAWQPANEPWLGPLSPSMLGLGLFGLVLVVLLALNGSWFRRASGSSYEAGLFVIAAATVASFFFFSTHMHENHLFLAVPLLIAVAGRSPRLAALAGAASVAVFMNEFLHDPEIPLGLPGFLSATSKAVDPHMGRPYTVLQVLGSLANTFLVAVIVLGTAAEALRLGRERDQSEEGA